MSIIVRLNAPIRTKENISKFNIWNKRKILFLRLLRGASTKVLIARTKYQNILCVDM